MSSTLTPTSPSWYARLEDSPDDVAALKRHFADSGFSFDEIDGKFALAAPQFEACGLGNTDAVIDVATKLLNAVNVALRLSDGCDGFELCGVVERRNGAIHRTMLCRTGVYRISGGELRVNGKPARSKEERLVSLMERDGSVDDIAHAQHVQLCGTSRALLDSTHLLAAHHETTRRIHPTPYAAQQPFGGVLRTGFQAAPPSFRRSWSLPHRQFWWSYGQRSLVSQIG